MSKIKDKVYEILRDELGSGVAIEDKTVVLNASGIDENNQRDLIMRLEEELGVDISDEDAGKLTTVKDIVAYLEKNKAGE